MYINEEVISFIEENAQDSKVKDINLKNLKIPKKIKKELLQCFALYEGARYFDIILGEELTIPPTFSEEIKEMDAAIPFGFNEFCKEAIQISKDVKKKLATSPAIVVDLKNQQAQLLNNKNNFMQGLFKEGWKNNPIVVSFLKHVDFLAYSSKALLFLYQDVIPKLISILEKLTKKNTNPELKVLLVKLENEKSAIRHAMVARLRNAAKKNDLEDDDVLFSVKEDLAVASPKFRDYSKQVTKSVSFHTIPHKKMTEKTWIQFSEILSTSPEQVVRDEYKKVWSEIRINSPIKLNAVERNHSVMLIPEGIRQSDIPVDIPSSWLHPGAYKRRVFFENNQYRILEINNQIAELKYRVENLKHPLKLNDILRTVDQINELNILVQETILIADEKKYGGLGRLFFSDTNNMLETWKKILFNVAKTDVFSIEEMFANKLLDLVQTKDICWDEDYKFLPQDINKIYQFLYPLVGKLVKYDKKTHLLFNLIKSNTSVIYKKENFILTFLNKFNQGNFKRNFIKDECNKINLEMAVKFAAQYTQDKDVKKALYFLCNLVNLNEEEINLDKLDIDKIKKSLLPLFKNQSDSLDSVTNILKTIVEKYLLPIVTDINSREYKLLSTIDFQEAEDWRLKKLEKLHEAEEYLEKMFSDSFITEEKIKQAKESIDILRALSSTRNPCLNNRIDEFVKPYLNSYQGQDNSLQAVFTHFGDESLILDYGKKLLNYYLQHGMYTDILNEEFFTKNKDLLKQVFPELFIEHLIQISSRTDDDFSDDMLKIVEKFQNIEEENTSVLEELDSLRLKKLKKYISQPTELNKIFDEISRSCIAFPALPKSTVGVIELFKDDRIKWNESIQIIIGKSKDKTLRKLGYVKWFETVALDPDLASQHQPAFLAYHSFELLLKDFGKEAIPDMLQKIEICLRNNVNITMDMIGIFQVLLSDRILLEFNRQDLKSLLSSVKKELEFKLKVKNAFSELVQLSSAASSTDEEIIEEIKTKYKRMKRREKDNDDKEARGIEQALEEYFRWLINKAVDLNINVEQQARYQKLLGALISSIDNVNLPTLLTLKKIKSIDIFKIKELFRLPYHTSGYISRGELQLDINESFVHLLPIFSKENLQKINNDLTHVLKKLYTIDPLKEILQILQKIVQQALDNKAIQLSEEELRYIKFYLCFKNIMNTLIGLSSQREIGRSLIASEQIKIDFNQSPYSSARYESFWKAWLEDTNKHGYFVELTWLNQKYSISQPQIQQHVTDENPNLISFKTVVEKFRDRKDQNEIPGHLWGYIFSCMEKPERLEASFKEIYLQLIDLVSVRVEKFETIFLGYDLPDVITFAELIENDNNLQNLIYDFSFMNSYPSCLQSLVDGILLSYAKQLKNAEDIPNEIKRLKKIEMFIRKTADSNHLLILENIQKGVVLNELVHQQMTNNYFKGLFKVQSLVLVNLVNHVIKINQSKFFGSIEKDFPVHIKETILVKLYQTEVMLMHPSSNLNKSVDLIEKCWSFIRNTIQKEGIDKDAYKLIDEFMEKNQVEIPFRCDVKLSVSSIHTTQMTY